METVRSNPIDCNFFGNLDCELIFCLSYFILFLHDFDSLCLLAKTFLKNRNLRLIAKNHIFPINKILFIRKIKKYSKSIFYVNLHLKKRAKFILSYIVVSRFNILLSILLLKHFNSNVKVSIATVPLVISLFISEKNSIVKCGPNFCYYLRVENTFGILILLIIIVISYPNSTLFQETLNSLNLILSQNFITLATYLIFLRICKADYLRYYLSFSCNTIYNLRTWLTFYNSRISEIRNSLESFLKKVQLNLFQDSLFISLHSKNSPNTSVSAEQTFKINFYSEICMIKKPANNRIYCPFSLMERTFKRCSSNINTPSELFILITNCKFNNSTLASLRLLKFFSNHVNILLIRSTNYFARCSLRSYENDSLICEASHCVTRLSSNININGSFSPPKIDRYHKSSIGRVIKYHHYFLTTILILRQGLLNFVYSDVLITTVENFRESYTPRIVSNKIIAIIHYVTGHSDRLVQILFSLKSFIFCMQVSTSRYTQIRLNVVLCKLINCSNSTHFKSRFCFSADFYHPFKIESPLTTSTKILNTVKSLNEILIYGKLCPNINSNSATHWKGFSCIRLNCSHIFKHSPYVQIACKVFLVPSSNSTKIFSFIHFLLLGILLLIKFPQPFLKSKLDKLRKASKKIKAKAFYLKKLFRNLCSLKQICKISVRKSSYLECVFFCPHPGVVAEKVFPVGKNLIKICHSNAEYMQVKVGWGGHLSKPSHD